MEEEKKVIDDDDYDDDEKNRCKLIEHNSANYVTIILIQLSKQSRQLSFSIAKGIQRKTCVFAEYVFVNKCGVAVMISLGS